MAKKFLLTFLFIFLFVGCIRSPANDEYDKRYREFIKKREKIRYGIELRVLRKALELYPQFKQEGLSENFDLGKFREMSRRDSLNTMEYLPAFFMIMEIEDSLKTPTGVRYLDKKYNPKVILIVKTGLGIE